MKFENVSLLKFFLGFVRARGSGSGKGDENGNVIENVKGKASKNKKRKGPSGGGAMVYIPKSGPCDVAPPCTPCRPVQLQCVPCVPCTPCIPFVYCP